MARNWILEHLQTYTFWLMDLGPLDGAGGLPIFLPTFGFSSISAPTVTLGVRSIKEANWPYPRKVLDGSATVSPIRMTRGVMFLDSEFYRWVDSAVRGGGDASGVGGIPVLNTILTHGPTYRRNLLLVHFFARSIGGPERVDPLKDPNDRGDQTPESIDQAATGAVSAGAFALAGTSAGLALESVSAGITVGATAVAAGALAVIGHYPIRIPAKAYLLKGCLPVMYRPGSDFDANSSAISMQELEVEVEEWEEISLAA